MWHKEMKGTVSSFRCFRAGLCISGNRASQSTAYDSFCPTVIAAISNRTCNACQLYFASHVMATHHKQALHPKVKFNDMAKTRPMRIAARRQRELMAIIAAGICLLRSQIQILMYILSLITISAGAVCRYPLPFLCCLTIVIL